MVPAHAEPDGHAGPQTLARLALERELVLAVRGRGTIPLRTRALPEPSRILETWLTNSREDTKSTRVKPSRERLVLGLALLPKELLSVLSPEGGVIWLASR